MELAVLTPLYLCMQSSVYSRCRYPRMVVWLVLATDFGFEL